jgi:hypothetical protein
LEITAPAPKHHLKGQAVFERVLYRMREKIRERQYVMTTHARKEMNDDGLTIYDVERGILSGEILERQKDVETAEWKYRIVGETVVGEVIEVVTKLSPTGKLAIITVYVP